MRAVAALFLLFAMTTAASPEEDPVVAVVGDHEVRMSYVQRQIQSVSLAQQIDVRDDVDRFVDSVIHEEVLFQYALQQARSEIGWREKLKATVVRTLLEEQVRDKVGVSDQEVADFYRKEIVDGDHEHIRVRHVAFSDAAQCDWAANQVHGPDDLSAIATIYHSNPVFAKRGGDLGFLMRRSRVLGFEREIFDLPEGKLHRIEKAEVCHLIWITERTTTAPPPFDEIKGRLHRQLEQRQEGALLQTVLEQARKAIVVERRTLP